MCGRDSGVEGADNHTSVMIRKLDEDLDTGFITKLKGARKNIPKRIKGKYNFVMLKLI
ncbi:hypothetical protein R9X47_02370 [Wukongibacter baidiensis]|uniref:hypothetical protein n=1 Tax=Wukongibacter baidiensis TaxID=1723361 RepID=UPI003D7F4790